MFNITELLKNETSVWERLKNYTYFGLLKRKK